MVRLKVCWCLWYVVSLWRFKFQMVQLEVVDEHRPVNQKQLLVDLQTPGTDEYGWYQSGLAEGNLKLNINLESDVTRSEKDAYKHLSAERRRQAINKKLDDLF